MVCYHYCGLESFVSIVRHRTLRLSNIFYMNDYKEVSWFFDIARGVLDENVEQGSGGAGSTSAGSECDIAVFKLRRMLEREPFDHVYAACFSRKEDDLSQWRGYANDGRGVAIGIDLDALCVKANCPVLRRMCVKYDEEEQRRESQRILMSLFGPGSSGNSGSSTSSSGSSTSSSSSSSSGSVNRVFRQLANLAPCYKNPAFADEGEVRVVVRTRVPPDRELDRAKFDKEWFADFPGPVRFFESCAGLVPFTTVRVPECALRIVRFGPKFGGYANKAAIRLFCGKRLPKGRIEFVDSRASYR